MYVFQIPQSIYGVLVCVWLQPRHDLIQVYLKPLFKSIHFSLKYTGYQQWRQMHMNENTPRKPLSLNMRLRKQNS